MRADRARGCATLLLLLASRAWAAPSSLNTIPTADVVPFRQLTTQVQNADTDFEGDASVFREPEPVLQTQLGLLPGRLEAGVDLAPVDSPRDYRPVFNLKAAPLQEGYAWPSIALGVAQVGSGNDAAYYLVVSRTLNYEQLQYRRFRAHHRNLKLRGLRAHAGVTATDGIAQAMAGTDLELADWFVLDADWISGRDHAATLGGTWILNPQTSLQTALFVGNRDARLGVQLGATHQFAW